MGQRPPARSVFVAVLVAATALVRAPIAAQDGARPPRTALEVRQWLTELSNWGRWGAEDQRGTLNLITPERRRAAARLVTEGVSVSLARDAETRPAADVRAPYEHAMLTAGMDALAVAFHGYAHTHVDALWHASIDDRSYNGYPRALGWEGGAPALSVHLLKDGILTRGVLMDIPRLKGVPYLEPGTAIYAEDLEAWEARAGVTVGPGDAVFVYTGRWARRAARGPWDVSEAAAGLHASAARWLKARDVALLGHDAGNEVTPTRVDGAAQPLHQLAIVALGLPLLDNCDLEAVAAAAAARRRWAFLLTAAPLPVPGGTGSPLNPIATF